MPCGDVTLALVGPSERAAEAAWRRRSRCATWTPSPPSRGLGVAYVEIRDGGHERTLEIRDPAGNPLVFYQAKG